MSRLLREIRELKAGDRVEIIWTDSYTEEANCWESVAEASVMMEEHVSSMGYFLCLIKKQDCLRIVADRFVDAGKVSRVTRLMTIPIGCITKVRRLK